MASPKRDRLVAAMSEAAAGPDWEVLDHQTVWYSERGIPMPEHMRTWPGKSGGHPYASWETYDRHIFLTLAGSTVILGVARSPWSARQGSYIPMTRAFKVLEDPKGVFEYRT